MSRVGKKIITIPSEVEVTINGQVVSAKGPKGTLSYTIHPLATMTMGEEGGAKILSVIVENPNDVFERSLWGTTRANVANMLQGVSDGYKKSLEVIGVGYRVAVQGTKVVLDVGFSHSVDFPLPDGITATVEKNILTLSGIDKILVGETAAQIRRIRKPEPYGGKGIKYTDETIRRKAGKAVKAGE